MTRWPRNFGASNPANPYHFLHSGGELDFFDGNFPALVTSIHEKLFTLPDDTIVYPGHGPATTIGDEKNSNPFVGTPAGYRFGDL